GRKRPLHRRLRQDALVKLLARPAPAGAKLEHQRPPRPRRLRARFVERWRARAPRGDDNAAPAERKEHQQSQDGDGARLHEHECSKSATGHPVHRDGTAAAAAGRAGAGLAESKRPGGGGGMAMLMWVTAPSPSSGLSNSAALPTTRVAKPPGFRYL